MAELDNEMFLFGECKWRSESVTRLNDLSVLPPRAPVCPRRAGGTNLMLFAFGRLFPELQLLAADPAERLYLVTGADM